MAQTAAHLMDHVIPHVPVRQWVLSLPIPLRLVTPALQVHLHCLVLDGVYRRGSHGEPVFVEVPAPSDEALQAVLHKIITRILKLLTRRGALVEEKGSTYMADNDTDSDEARTLGPLQAVACTYRIAFGPRAGQKVLTLQGAMPKEAGFKRKLCADIQRFSLHAAVRCAADGRKALEQLCRYITRPALANERVQCNAAGQVVLKLKTPWHDGTTHMVMSPLEFMQRLAALVPRPRLHLICFHGVLARPMPSCARWWCHKSRSSPPRQQHKPPRARRAVRIAGRRA
jgi:Putative transposase